MDTPKQQDGTALAPVSGSVLRSYEVPEGTVLHAGGIPVKLKDAATILSAFPMRIDIVPGAGPMLLPNDAHITGRPNVADDPRR